ncbi:hypothetical protein KAFR_0E01100 [Kazachstania africana CBS 2517]|uniref:Fluoride ion transporter CrcB n=1 Tax=Kazachstania africana (strain ATCC 22294 / BCRC 22015 / CBS 2517 / CECT 1963 / NBRC 1671 / NRRL Y-8276) TaxID=1071382 RepID=H2AV64_KAZAF|nr:hypothetical protein KAFR_0E01100 [Kazachstania africana CBS 2517]CCF58264.1 hypothetical protein KAFR_0E01100 [Kazachstania africana CBS 2517]
MFQISSSLWKSRIHFFSVYISATILGTFTREGITQLSNYSYSYVAASSVIWSNFVACMIMGICQGLNDKQYAWFSGDMSDLFVALTTGYCGSVSSFSTMMIEIFEHSASLTTSNIKNSTKLPNRAYGIMEFLSVVILQLFVSMSSLIFGRKLASDVLVYYCSTSKLIPVQDSDTDESQSSPNHKFESKPKMTETFPPNKLMSGLLRLLDTLLYILAIPLIALLIVLVCVYNNYARARYTLGPLFGIFGSLLRFYLSLYANPLSKTFPIGTFIANIFATLVLSIITLVTHGKQHFHSAIPVAHSKTACRVATALGTGFCGCLSTISTFINEAYKLPFRSMLVYYFVSIFVGYCIVVITLGSYAWTRGLTNSVC